MSRDLFSYPWDVVVIGGGPAGTMAACAAAESGAKTLLVEQGAYLGGSLTRMGVSPMMSFHAGATQVVRGLPQRLVERLIERGFSLGHIADPVGFCSSVTPFDPEGLKVVLDEMCADAGVTCLFHAQLLGAEVTGEVISTVTLATKEGPRRIQARVFIDATGDADLATAAGCPVTQGRNSDGACQPMTMNFRVRGVDSSALEAFKQDNPDQVYHGSPENERVSVRSGISGAYQIIKQAREIGEITYSREMVLAFEGNNPGEFTINMSRVIGLNPTDAFDLSQAEIVGRAQVWETFEFLKRRVPGFAGAVMVSTGPNIGVRESRRIQGDFVLEAQDLVSNRMFPDAVAMGGYPIDLHDPDGRSGMHFVSLKPGSWYSIPYRALLPRKVSNLLVAGRCVSVSHEALAAIRVTPIVMAFSEGAGVAAALAARAATNSLADAVTDAVADTAADKAANSIENSPAKPRILAGDVHSVDVEQLRTKLTDRGVFLQPYSER